MSNDVKSPTAQLVKDYADRFLAALERIAIALEKTASVTAAPIVLNPTPPVEAAAPVDALVPSEPTPSIAYDTVRAAILAYQDTKGAHAAQAILKQFGARYIMDLKADPSQYQAVLDALT